MEMDVSVGKLLRLGKGQEMLLQQHKPRVSTALCEASLARRLEHLVPASRLAHPPSRVHPIPSTNGCVDHSYGFFGQTVYTEGLNGLLQEARLWDPSTHFSLALGLF